jgi:hydrogenase maturation protease
MKDKMDRVLIIGYGNPYRRDDGVALYVINAIRERVRLPALEPDEDGLDELGGAPLDTVMLHQLLPELAPVLANYRTVVFVDAHAGTIPEDVRVVPVTEEYGFQAVTHHMSPGMLLALARAASGTAPQAYLVSIRGDDFDFGTELSELSKKHAAEAVETILALIA